MVKRRRDSKGIMLKKGESERAGGGYDYRWTQNGERCCSPRKIRKTQKCGITRN